jgi:hypothetical protein
MTRRILAGLAILLSVASVIVAVRVTTPPPVPDVGEPFDVRKFCEVYVPREKNAFTEYRKAGAGMVNPTTILERANRAGAPIDWKPYFNSLDDTIEKGWQFANDDVRLWLEANELPLAAWKRGTDCDDALEIPPAELNVGSQVQFFYMPARDLANLARLEAERVSAGKRPAEAWIWYRALLRSSCHLSMHSIATSRSVGGFIYERTVGQVLRWAARPEITASDLRQALADTLVVNAMMPPPSDSLKCDYLWSRTYIDGAIEMGTRDDAPIWGHSDYREQTRRSLNLVYANLLSQIDRPRYLRAPCCGKLGLFGPDPAAPRAPKDSSESVLADAEIEERILSSAGPGAKILEHLVPPTNMVATFDIERAQQAAFVLRLALQLYYREHRQFPATLDALVKIGYLKSIPADPFGKGEPFHYRRETNSLEGAVLWSIWTDGIDQQGKLDVRRDETDGTGDRIYKIAVPRRRKDEG